VITWFLQFALSPTTDIYPTPQEMPCLNETPTTHVNISPLNPMKGEFPNFTPSFTPTSVFLFPTLFPHIRSYAFSLHDTNISYTVLLYLINIATSREDNNCEITRVILT